MILSKPAAFFDGVRPIFGGSLSQPQVDGMNAILSAFQPSIDPRWAAYGLATATWETGHTMQPIREWGLGRGRPYGHPDPTTGQTYYGRGFVQLTWRANYARMGAILGIDLLDNPDLALRPAIAALILYEGMTRGIFTTRNLADYFNTQRDDPVDARRIINGLDHAAQIAAIYRQFLAAIHAAL